MQGYNFYFILNDGRILQKQLMKATAKAIVPILVFTPGTKNQNKLSRKYLPTGTVCVCGR